MSRNLRLAIMITSGSLLAATAGVLISVQVAQGQGTAPTRTVTVDVGTGEQGPVGPAGPPGPAGTGGTCAGAPAGYSPGILQINHPGGQVLIWTCLEPE
jgi:hypothetical protein